MYAGLVLLATQVLRVHSSAKDAVDLDAVRDDLAGVVDAAGAGPYLGVGQAGLAVCPHK